jgi:hypothetical protein
LFATVASQIPLRHLTPASGRQDHTTSPSADNALSSAAPPTSIASQPCVRDDRETPLCVWAGMAADKEVICAKWERKYFCEEDWTGSISLKAKENFPSPRRACAVSLGRFRSKPDRKCALRLWVWIRNRHAKPLWHLSTERTGITARKQLYDFHIIACGKRDDLGFRVMCVV